MEFEFEAWEMPVAISKFFKKKFMLELAGCNYSYHYLSIFTI